MESLLDCELLHTVLVVFCALPVFWVLNILILSTTRGMTIRELITLPLFTLGIVATIWSIVDACLMVSPKLRSKLGIHLFISGLDTYSTRSEELFSWRDIAQTFVFAVMNATCCVAIVSIPAVVQSNLFHAYSDWVMTHITTFLVNGQLCVAVIHSAGMYT